MDDFAITASNLLARRRSPFFLSTLAGVAAALASTGTEAAQAQAVPQDSSDPGRHEENHPTKAEQVHPERTVHTFHIPSGRLGEALELFQKETGLKLALPSQHIADIATRGSEGVLMAQEALTKILEGTGIVAEFLPTGTIALRLRGDTQDVTVTADSLQSPKYTAPLLDLPQTVQTITQDTLQSTASTTLVEALRTVPGITFGAGEGGNPLGDRPFIRGLDSQSSTYIDGIRDIAAQSRETFDVDSIEVAEGPGGAYGGRGTGGGSININSKLARRDRFIAGSFMPGTVGYRRALVDGNTKLHDGIYGRLTGMWHNADVAGRDGVSTARWGVAPSVAFGVGKPTRLFLDYYHLVQNNIPDSGIPYNNPSTVPTVDPGPRLYQAGDGEPITLPNRNIFYGLLDRDHDRDTAKIATGRLERNLWHEGSLVRNSFRYERTEQDYLWTQPDDSKGNIYYGLLFRRINSRVSAVFTADNQTDLSGQFKTGGIRHTYAAGIEFSKERGNNDAYTNNSLSFTGNAEFCPHGAGAVSGYNCVNLFSPNDKDPWTLTGTTTLNHAPTHSSTVSKSVYGFDTVIFNSHFQGTFGARYDRYDSQFSTARTTVPAASYAVTNNIGTYLAGLIYKPDHATSVYGTVSTAAIPTGNALQQGSDTSTLNSTVNADLQPETIREEEVGVKRELGGGKALARIDFYREDIQNVRITQADGTIAAAGNDRTLGAEVGLSGKLTRKWDLSGGYSYIDAILVQAGGAGTANGLTNGTFLPDTAKHGVSLTSNYQVLRRLRAGGGVYYLSKVWGNQAMNKWVPGYVREDLFGDYVINRHFDLQANVLNLSNKLYYSQAYPTHYATMAPGRSAVFGFNVKF